MERSISKFRHSRSPDRRDDRLEDRDRDRQYRKREKYRQSRSPSPKASRRSHSHRSRSPVERERDRKGHGTNRVNPSPSKVLGVFGLSVHTTEDQVHQIFSKFGLIRMKLVYDTKTGRSRGFCFVYYESTEDARVAKDNCTGMEIDGKRIRVDFSLTARPHSPTPGVYMGRSTRDHGDEPDRRRPMERDRLDYHNKSSKYTSHRSSAVFGRRRSPSPQYRRRRNRSDSRSPRIRTR